MNWSKQEVELLIKVFKEDKLKNIQIAKLFNRRWPTIREKARSLGLYKNPQLNVYHLDHNYFDNIDTHIKAYFLGFLYADGCNYIKRGVISLCLENTDSYILEKLKECIGYTGPLYNDRDKYTKLSFYSRHMSTILNNIGMVERKSLVLKFPNISKKYINSFILGYFDGDGCIWLDKGNKAVIEIVGAKNLIEGINKHLNKLCNITHLHPIKRQNIYKIKYGKKENVKMIKEYMYKNSNIYLYRKKDRFDRADFLLRNIKANKI